MKLSRWPCLREWSFFLSMRSSRSSRTNDIHEARRIAANIAKLPGLLRPPQ